MKSALPFFAAVLLCASPALAEVKLQNFHAFETAPTMKVGAAFGEIVNTGTESDKLLSAESPVAGHVEIHEMSQDDGVMKMRKVKDVEIPAGKSVSLNPKSYHLMLMDLKKPLKKGDEFPVSLTFEKTGTIHIETEVQSRAPVAAKDTHSMDHMGMHH